MTTELKQDGAGAGLRLDGEIETVDAAALQALLVEALAGGKDLSLNLDGVLKMDVTAVQLLLAAQRDYRASGLNFGLQGELPEAVAMMAAAMGLQSFPGQRGAE